MTVFSPGVFLSAPPRHLPGASAVPRYSRVEWSASAPPLPRSRARGAKRLGLNYERRVIDVLSAIYGDSFTVAPTIYYWRSGVAHRAIPDGILRLGDETLIIEVKLSHTIDVWDQLMNRYARLVAILEPGRRIRTVEVCRYYDPAIPVEHTLIQSLHRPATGLEVLQWKI